MKTITHEDNSKARRNQQKAHKIFKHTAVEEPKSNSNVPTYYYIVHEGVGKMPLARAFHALAINADTTNDAKRRREKSLRASC